MMKIVSRMATIMINNKWFNFVVLWDFGYLMLKSFKYSLYRHNSVYSVSEANRNVVPLISLNIVYIFDIILQNCSLINDW